MKYKISKALNYFLFCSLVFFLLSSLIIVFFDKFQIHQFLNQFHSDFLDLFFSIITHFGDGLFSILCFLILFLFNKRLGIIILLSFLLSSLITQGLKHFIFDDSMRPLFYIQNNQLNVPLVDGINIHTSFSFPSGHTTSVFALFTLFSLMVNKRRYSLILFFTCIIISFSRIYLSQHFLIDVLGGAIVGMTSAYFIYFLFYDKLHHYNNSLKFK